MNPLHDFRKLPGKDTITQTPAGHRVQFGETIDDKSLVREFQNRVSAVFVNQAVINFIRDNILSVELRNILQLLFGHHNAGRIGRGVNQNGLCFIVYRPFYVCDRLGPGRKFLFNVFGTILKSLFRVSFNLLNLAAGREDKILVAGIARIGNDYFIAMI